jgi:uncharacterized membrane protein
MDDRTAEVVGSQNGRNNRSGTMPNEQKPKRKRFRYKIDNDRRVRVTGPGWVWLTPDKKHVRYVPDAGPIDPASSTKLQFHANDPEG